MYCPTCGAAASDGQSFCTQCGDAIPLQHGANQASLVQSSSIVNAWSAKAIVGFMLSLTIGLFPFFGILAAIAAIVLGAVARKNVRDAHGALRGGGLALAALIIGIIEVVVMMILIIAAVTSSGNGTSGDSGTSGTSGLGKVSVTQISQASGASSGVPRIGSTSLAIALNTWSAAGVSNSTDASYFWD